MVWTVVWLPEAETQLTTLWLKSEDRNQLSESLNSVESRLRVRPLEEGESRVGPFRVTYQSPVGVLFAVSPEDCRVTVYRVWTA